MTVRSPAERYTDLVGRALRALRPYAQDVVVIGGFAASVYRHLPGFDDRGLKIRVTQDLDVVLSDPLEVRGDTLLHAALEQEGLVAYTGLGFDRRPAIHRFQLAEDGSARPANVYLEFLVPMVGKPRDEPAGLQGKTVIAQAVRFVDLLMREPVTVDDPRHGSFRVPHPLAFVIQKTRIREERLGRGAKDQADAFVVIDGFHAQWDSWRELWQRWSEHPHHGPWLVSTAQTWRMLYKTADAPGPREVTSFYRPAIDEVTVHAVMKHFLNTMSLTESPHA